MATPLSSGFVLTLIGIYCPAVMLLNESVVSPGNASETELAQSASDGTRYQALKSDNLTLFGAREQIK